MGIFRKNSLDEERVIKPAKEEENRITVDDEIASSLQEANIQEILNFLNSMKVKAKDKRNLYEIYDRMAVDSIVSGALEILSDDIVKKDLIRDKRFWAEAAINDSEDARRIVDKVNTFLTSFGMDTKAWGYAYNLLKYGEMYLKTYNKEFAEKSITDEFKDSKGTIFEPVSNQADLVTLEKYGTTVGYGVVKRSETDSSVTEGYTLVGKEEYIHIVCDKKMMREEIKLSYQKDDRKVVDTFKSVIGSSYLEPARQAWSIIDLIETLLLYVRFNKSDVFRVVSVEVGSAGRTESTRILRNVKRLFNNQDSMNVKDKTYSGYKKPIPHGENIYIATKQGKGEIKIDDVGGNTDIKEIIDLEYWLNKLVAALRTPKAYIGLDDGNLTGLNNQSLTRQDIRYCRTVEAYQECLVRGIKDMCDFYLEATGDGGDTDLYEIKATKIVSAETADKMEDTTSKIELAKIIMEFFSSIEGVQMDEITKVVIDKILDLSEIDPAFGDVFNKEKGQEPTKTEEDPAGIVEESEE